MPDRKGGTPHLGAMDLEEHLADPGRKQAFVTPMFDLIAPRYDEFTRVFSFGMDRRWKRVLLEAAAGVVPLGGAVADLASGTGDLALGLARLRPDVHVTTVDISPAMVSLARQRIELARAPRVVVTTGDLASLALRSASVDLITAGYAFRNAPDWRSALSEAARVLRPGGHLITLDFYLPRSRAWRQVFLGWLWATGRLVGWKWHDEPLAYGYIARSIAHFTDWMRFSQALGAASFETLGVTTWLGGGIAVHHAVRR